MNYITLFSGGPEVSKLCLGTGRFGAGLPREEALKQLDLFFDRGGNFVDTARVYADWVPGGHGASESTVGAWLKKRKLRNRVIISSKGAHPDLKTMHIPRMGPADVRFDLEESLRALGTDYIDLYFLHRDDPSRPVGEILDMLESFRKEGKIRHYGCSNWTLNRIEEADKAAAALVSAYVMNQDFPAVPIASFSSAEQLEETLPAADFVFPPELLEEIRSIKCFTL
jgi:aryl-alcohol dehydrogenase-like predicted oxidoreductase